MRWFTLSTKPTTTKGRIKAERYLREVNNIMTDRLFYGDFSVHPGRFGLSALVPERPSFKDWSQAHG